MASPVDTSVKFYRQDFPGAPTLNGVAGSLVGLYTACLCTGFGLRTAVSITVSGGMATVTLDSDAKNPNLLHSVILVDGVTGGMADLNGEQKVTAATLATLQFATAVADGAATGTITVKTAPAGWEARFTGTNKAVYRSLSPESLGMHLWVNDADTTGCNVRGFEDMTDVDAGTGPFPTATESPAGWYWGKSSAANATANRWALFSNHRAVYSAPQMSSGANATYISSPLYAFGDMRAHLSVDAFSALITGSATAVNAVPSAGSLTGYVATANNARAPRARTGVGAAVAAYLYPSTVSGVSSYSGNDAALGVYPPPDGKLRFVPIMVNEVAAIGASTVLRGEVPGVWHVPQTELYKYFAPGDIVHVTAGELAGRRLYVLYAGAYSSDTSGAVAGRIFVDITGPW